jgi:hypothetical protein
VAIYCYDFFFRLERNHWHNYYLNIIYDEKNLTNIFFIFCFWFCPYIVQLIQASSLCTKVVASCTEVHCPTHCEKYARGAKVLKASCAFYNLCTCVMDRQPPGEIAPCDIGLGLCDSKCPYDCCNHQCKLKYPNTGLGGCVEAYNHNFCMCHYYRWLTEFILNSYK